MRRRRTNCLRFSGRELPTNVVAHATGVSISHTFDNDKRRLQAQEHLTVVVHLVTKNTTPPRFHSNARPHLSAFHFNRVLTRRIVRSHEVHVTQHDITTVYESSGLVESGPYGVESQFNFEGDLWIRKRPQSLEKEDIY